MRLNNKGYAVSGILYTMLLMFVLILAGVLSMMSTRKVLLDKMKKEVENNLNGQDRTIVPEPPVLEPQVYDFEYTGAVQTFGVPYTGKYKLEVWGANGGGYNTSYSTTGGRGGYSVGTINLSSGTTLYIYVGGQGGLANTAGGFNGGGNSKSYGGSGGGASDIRIGVDSLYARVIVAGGGGGGGYQNTIGGYGGGVTGGDGGAGNVTAGGGGTATSGGTAGSGGVVGVFGGAQERTSGAGGGGGGGWYGGGSGMSGGTDSGGGGGSGYVYTPETASQCPSGCLLNSSHYLIGATTYGGNTTFAAPDGTSETGHSGNGYVRITYIP